MSTNAELAHLFRLLKAPAAARALPKLAERARQEEWSYERFAHALLSSETSARDSHGGESRIRAALPGPQNAGGVRLHLPTLGQKAGDRAPRPARLPPRTLQHHRARPARSWFTLPSSLSSLVKQSSTVLGHLDS